MAVDSGAIRQGVADASAWADRTQEALGLDAPSVAPRAIATRVGPDVGSDGQPVLLCSVAAQPPGTFEDVLTYGYGSGRAGPPLGPPQDWIIPESVAPRATDQTRVVETALAAETAAATKTEGPVLAGASGNRRRWRAPAALLVAAAVVVGGALAYNHSQHSSSPVNGVPQLAGGSGHAPTATEINGAYFLTTTVTGGDKSCTGGQAGIRVLIDGSKISWSTINGATFVGVLRGDESFDATSAVAGATAQVQVKGRFSLNGTTPQMIGTTTYGSCTGSLSASRIGS